MRKKRALSTCLYPVGAFCRVTLLLHLFRAAIRKWSLAMRGFGLLWWHPHIFLSGVCSSEVSKLTVPEPLHIFYWCHRSRSQVSQTGWAVFSFLDRIVQSLQLLSLAEKEEWQNRAVWWQAQGGTPRGMWAVTKHCHLGLCREEGKTQSVMKFWTLAETAADISEAPMANRSSSSTEIWKNKHGYLTLSLLFKYPCDVADSIWKFRFSLPGKHDMINDTLGIDLVRMGWIAARLRSPQCNAHHRCAQLLLVSAVRGVSPARKLQEGAALKGAGRIAHI